MLLILMSMWMQYARAQSDEAVQLTLNIEKLAQLKQILADLKRGYEIVSKGYHTVKDLSEGNFSLHKTFLDGLLEVSPTVRKYKRVGDIINHQVLLVREYKQAYARFQSADVFTPSQIAYIGRVYDRLSGESLKNLDDLLNIITASRLRMSDEERISAIDRIYLEMDQKLQFLRSFNGSTAQLALQRKQAQAEINSSKLIHGIK